MELPVLITLAIGLVAIMAIAWIVQQVSRSSGLVDIFWSFAVGLGGVAAVLLPATDGVMERRVAVGLLVAIWALRLGMHILKRNGHGDDPRYVQLTRDWGRKAPFYMFFFLQIQAAAAFILVLAVRLASVNPAPFPGFLDLAGFFIIVIAIGGESLADAQLARFGRTHKGAVCDVGLWKWSRHPNYFFEWLAWVGWAVVAFDLTHPLSLLAFLAPALMYYLLVYASGIPPLEQHMLATRGDRFRAYMARTSAFFPLPPKRLPPKTPLHIDGSPT